MNKVHSGMAIRKTPALHCPRVRQLSLSVLCALCFVTCRGSLRLSCSQLGFNDIDGTGYAGRNAT